MPALDRPLLLYDGSCGFCVRWIVRVRQLTGERVEYAPFQRVVGEEGWLDARLADRPAVTRAECARSVLLLEPGGGSSRAAEAAFRTLAHAPPVPGNAPLRLPLLAYRTLPGARVLAEACYRFVARHRTGLLRLERVLAGDVLVPAWERSRALFLRGLGVVALVAFLSLWVQIDGLAGSHGIAPAADAVAAGLDGAGSGGEAAWWRSPSLLWLGAGDAMLHGLCAAGVALSLLLAAGIAPAACALLLWADYLSLTHGCGPFLAFQWDLLLIETLLLAAFVAPWRPRLAGAAPPSRLARLLVWWLLFRFMFESGVVKLTSGDDAWPGFTALTWHYMTQPLPHVLGWWAWQMPRAVHEISCAGTLAIECGVPFLILAPRRLRHLACALLALLQLGIAATGNYGWFNLLTLVLCASLLDDQALAALSAGARRVLHLPRGAARRQAGHRLARSDRPADTRGEAFGPPGDSCGAPGAAPELPPLAVRRRAAPVQRAALLAFALPVLVLGGRQLAELWGPGPRVTWEQYRAGVVPTLFADGPGAASAVLEVRAEPFLSVNPYGLFRVMTRTRPEITLRGSADGETWRDYAFRWKPGDVRRAPGWAQPHMPRLDWQLWFEALAWEPYATGPLRQARDPSPWFRSLLARLAEGEPSVLALLAGNPFPEGPPRFVRASLSEYRFTTREERARTGAWWVDEPLPGAWVQVTRRP